MAKKCIMSKDGRCTSDYSPLKCNGIGIPDDCTYALKIKKERQEEIKLARQCLKFKGFHCGNEECLNLSCPLNKSWESDLL